MINLKKVSKAAEIEKQRLIFESMEAVALRNEIPLEEIGIILEEAVTKSFHSKFDPDAELEFVINFEAKEFYLINEKKIVVADEESTTEELRAIEIPLSIAKKIKSTIKVGDEISEEVDFHTYSRTVAQQIKQLFIQKIKSKRKEIIYSKHKGLIGEMIDVIVETMGSSHVLFRMDDGTDAFMPKKFMALNTKYKIHQRVQVYVEDVLEESKDSQVIVSNSSKALVKRALENEVPEIMDGVIEVVGMARIPGVRTKVAVRTLDSNVDPVGAIIGTSGQRINQIVKRLNGEKIDVVRYSSDINEYVANAISPARVIAVLDKKEGNDKKIVVVPNKHKTLAIGAKGYNARLVAELVSIGVDIFSQDEAVEAKLNFSWNGNISQEEIQKLDEGQNISKWGGRKTRSRNNGFVSSFNINEFNDDILGFQEEIETYKSPTEETDLIDEKITTLDIKSELDSIFTDEELKKMESEFELDDELAEFADIDLDSFQDENNK